MKVTITVRARLKGDSKSAKQLHDQVTGATKEMARQAGDLTHAVYLNPMDDRDFLGIDTWDSAEHAQAFAGSPQIQDFFSKLFEGRPEIKMFVDSDWNQW